MWWCNIVFYQSNQYIVISTKLVSHANARHFHTFYPISNSKYALQSCSVGLCIAYLEFEIGHRMWKWRAQACDTSFVEMTKYWLDWLITIPQHATRFTAVHCNELPDMVIFHVTHHLWFTRKVLRKVHDHIRAFIPMYCRKCSGVPRYCV